VGVDSDPGVKRLSAHRWFAAGTAIVLFAACDHGLPTRPPSTFVLTGRVTEPVGVAVAGARIVVLQGIGQGNGTVTPFDGTYSIRGVAGPVTTEFAADGYVTSMLQVVIDRHQSLDVQIVPVTPPAHVAGTWLVTFEASPNCGTLPADVRTRRYWAEVKQDGARIVFEFSGAALQGMSSFSGTVQGNRVALSLGDWDRDGIVERLGDDRFLALMGEMSAAVAASPIAGHFDGGFYIGETPHRPYKVAGCTHSDHRVTLQRHK
jgi:hypothetical protein